MKSSTALPIPSNPTRKLFYRIQEVAQMTGLKPYVLRYWETEFRELAPAKDASDQRRYRPTDIETVLTIRKLLYEDRYTIEGARKRLRDELRTRRQGAMTVAEVASDVDAKVVERAVRVAAPTRRAVRRGTESVQNERIEKSARGNGNVAMKDIRTPARIDLTILKLRMEVSDLLAMLS